MPPRLLLVLLLALPPALPAQEPEAATAPDLASFTTQWCTRCHHGPAPRGGLSLAEFGGDPARAADRAILRKMQARLTAGEMPPPPAPAPPRRIVEALVAGIARTLAATPPPADPGRVPPRRLSRVEYANTIRDLLGVDPPVAGFPADDLGYGFDNIADVLSVSPLLLENYAAAAERIADEAIVAEDPAHPPVRRFEAEAMAGSLPDDEPGRPVRVLYANGDVAQRVALPRDGTYAVRVRAYGQQAGPDKARLRFVIDETPAGEVDVAATETAPEVYEARARVSRGDHVAAVAFVNDYYDPQNPDPQNRDRNLVVDWVEVVGPLDPRPQPWAHRWIFAADPGGTDLAARARAVLRPLCSRAWRRPAGDPEIERLVTLVAAVAAEEGAFERGVQVALQAILTSPRFLFRLEADPEPRPPEDRRTLDGYEQATRLSYFLWSSLPDDRLTDLAARGALTDPTVLEAEALRMLRDPRASALAENFAAQWLELRNLADVAPDPGKFPEFDEELRRAMRRETEMFFEAVLRERRPLRELIDADFTFVNERLAAHYGLPGIHGPHLRRVRLDDGRRGGLLGQASIHAVTSNPTRTSPVKRGKWILENMLDAPPPPPPPNVGALDDGQEAATAASLRERLARHRADPTCASCHDRMDPLGFALENFDAIGRWRETDGPFPIDASGRLPGGQAISGPAELKAVLGAQTAAFARCVLKKLFVYAIGRGVTEADAAALDRAAAGLSAPDPTIADLILAVVRQDAFRCRRIAE